MDKRIRYGLWALGAALAAGGARAQAPSAPVADSVWVSPFERLDANHDGRIDAEEYLAEKKREWARRSNGTTMGIGSCAQAGLDRMAAAGATEVSPTWAKQAQDSCAKMDKRHDGSLTWEEFAGPTWAYFKLLDADHDGYLSPREFADQGVSALRSSPKPPPMTERQRAVVERDLQRVRTMHRAPRTVEQVKAEIERPSQAPGPGPARVRPRTPGTVPVTAPAPAPRPEAAAASAAPETQRERSVRENIMNWLR